MTIKERSYLTRAMAMSGSQLDFKNINKFTVDKHAAGGLGEKTSLILNPLLLSLGFAVPMVSGRGLGHTGGTVDKMESIPNYRTNLTMEEMKQAVEKIGGFLCG